MILTAEITKDKDEIEIFFDRDGYELLIRSLHEIKTSSEVEYDDAHLMTKEWGGGELTSDVMNEGNTLINHLKLVFVGRA